MFEKFICGCADIAVVAFEEQRTFMLEHISSSFELVLLGIPAERTAKIVQSFALPLELKQLGRNHANVFVVDLNGHLVII